MVKSGFRIFALMLLSALLGAPAAAQSLPLLSGTDLVKALRSGGYNIYFRHAATEWEQADTVDAAADWLSCDPAIMRQLSETGRREARAVGNAMRGLQIPVSEVLASPYCRTMETASLLNLGPVTASTEVMNMRAAEYFGGQAAIIASARRLLASAPKPGANRVIVAHGNLARDATQVYPSEGEGLVFVPAGQQGFHLVGRLTLADWFRIAAEP